MATAAVAAAGKTVHDEDEEQQRAVAQVRAMRYEQTRTIERLSVLEAQISEHRLALEALKKVEPSRRCHRLVAGVLIERTAGEILPALQKSMEVLQHDAAELRELLEKRDKELVAFMAEHKMRFVSEEEASEAMRKAQEAK